MRPPHRQVLASAVFVLDGAIIATAMTRLHAGRRGERASQGGEDSAVVARRNGIATRQAARP